MTTCPISLPISGNSSTNFSLKWQRTNWRMRNFLLWYCRRYIPFDNTPSCYAYCMLHIQSGSVCDMRYTESDRYYTHFSFRFPRKAQKIRWRELKSITSNAFTRSSLEMSSAHTFHIVCYSRWFFFQIYSLPILSWNFLHSSFFNLWILWNDYVSKQYSIVFSFSLQWDNRYSFMNTDAICCIIIT